jgi:hypothetical protein
MLAKRRYIRGGESWYRLCVRGHPQEGRGRIRRADPF